MGRCLRHEYGNKLSAVSLIHRIFHERFKLSFSDSKMNGNLIIKNASELVSCSGFRAKTGKEMVELHVIPDGAVVIKEGLISALGATAEILVELEKSGSDLSGYEVIDAENKAGNLIYNKKKGGIIHC